MDMKKILWTLALVFTFQVMAVSVQAAPKNSASRQVVAYSDTTSLDSAMTAAMGNWDDADDWDDWDEWEHANSTSLMEKMGVENVLLDGIGGMFFVIVVLIIIFILAPVALIGIILYFVFRNRKEKMKLMEMAIKNGKTIPLDAMGTPCAGGDDYLWNKGIRQVFVGAGLALLLWFILDGLGLAIGGFVMILGFGNMAIGHNVMKRKREQNLRDQYYRQNREETTSEEQK